MSNGGSAIDGVGHRGRRDGKTTFVFDGNHRGRCAVAQSRRSCSKGIDTNVRKPCNGLSSSAGCVEHRLIAVVLNEGYHCNLVEIRQVGRGGYLKDKHLRLACSPAVGHSGSACIGNHFAHNLVEIGLAIGSRSRRVVHLFFDYGYMKLKGAGGT